MMNLYVEHSGLMYSIALSYLRDHYDAQDAVNDAVIRLIDKIPELREKNCFVLRSYIVSTITRTSLNAYKKRSRRQESTFFAEPEVFENVSDEAETVDAKVIENATHDEMMQVLAELPQRERDLLCLKYYEEWADDEIADVLGIGKDSVRTYMTRARRHMHALLERRGVHHA